MPEKTVEFVVFLEIAINQKLEYLPPLTHDKLSAHPIIIIFIIIPPPLG